MLGTFSYEKGRWVGKLMDLGWYNILDGRLSNQYSRILTTLKDLYVYRMNRSWQIKNRLLDICCSHGHHQVHGIISEVVTADKIHL